MHYKSLFWDSLTRWAQMHPLPSSPPALLHISLPILSKYTPSLSPLFYAYIHPAPTFFPIPMPPFIVSTSSAPSLPHFRFFRPFIVLSLLPVPYPFLPLYIPLLPYAPQPLPGPSHPPGPLPLIFAFLTDLWMHSCMYFSAIPYIHVHMWLPTLNPWHLTAFWGWKYLPREG